jgi:thiamine biosynthesis lipoprotein
MKIMFNKPLLIFLAAALLVAAPSCAKKEQRLFRKSSVIMATLVGITVSSDSDRQAEEAIDRAMKEIRELERLLSFWTEDSEIAAINREAGAKPVKVSPVTLDIIERSVSISEKTGGAFDPTIGPLMRLWDFKERKRPGEEEIQRTLGLVDYREMKTDKAQSTAFLGRKGMSFDTGGIAKGYAADRAVEALKAGGIRAGLVSIAGDIRAFGLKPDGEPWRIGIRDPRGQRSEIIATLELTDEAVSTSGDYERFFMEDGVRYHHLLDPRTGQPARGCRSVTVIAKEAVLTDGLSTGVFVMGPEKGMGLLEEMGLEGVIVDEEGGIHVTGGLKDRLVWTEPPQKPHLNSN